MKHTEEMKVWLKGENVRLNSCKETVKHYKNQEKLVAQAIALEEQQIVLIKQSIAKALETWRKV